jgi:hypothetical protein
MAAHNSDSLKPDSVYPKPEYSRLLAQEFVPPEMAESSCQWRGGSAQLPLSGSARPAQSEEGGSICSPQTS